MPDAGRVPGRFVPTLTEVFEPTSASMSGDRPQETTPSEDKLVAAVMQELQREGANSLSAMVERELQARAEKLLVELRPEIEILVRRRVEQELAKPAATTGGAERPDFSQI